LKREIERKFLITSNDYKQNISSKYDIIQGYLSTKPSRTVRIRVGGGKGYLTIKGGTSKNGLCRLEWEKELPLEEADELMALCLPNKIEKTRCKVNYKGWLFEVDIFKGINEGLKIAEIELDSEADIFEKPKWLGEEVTGIKKYYNSQLCQNPFTKW
jgi:adenylate cyclase